MNVRLLRRIAKVIQEKPKEFDMGNWHRDNTVEFGGTTALCELPKERQFSCTTTHCIAGWAQVLSPKRRDCKKLTASDARRLLGLTEEEAIRLFYVYFDDGLTCSKWPKRFQGRKYRWNPTAKQAAARIEWFIKTKGAE